MSSESTSQQVTEISGESGEQILSLLQVQGGEEGSGHETIQLMTTTGDGEGIDGQETLLLQPAIEVNGERHVILQQAQDPNTGEVLVFLQGENGETVCLPPEALNANIVQMGDGSGQVYTLALPSDGDGSSVVVVSESDGAMVEGGATLMTDETLGNVIAATTSSAGTIDLAGTIETIVTSGETFNIEQLACEAAASSSSASSLATSSGTQVVQSVVGPLMATTVASSSTTDPNEGSVETTSSSSTSVSSSITMPPPPTPTTTTISMGREIETSNLKTDNQGNVDVSSITAGSSESEIASTIVTEEEEGTGTTTTTQATTSSEAATEAAAIASIVEGINSMSNCDDINSKLSEAVSKLQDDKDIIISDKSEVTVEGNNMNYGSAVIQVQDANSTTSLDSLVANAMLAAGESNYVIMTTGEDGELPKEINLADVINAGSASGQTIFLQTSEGLVACQAATTGEDGSLQIVADGSGNAIAVSTSSNATSSSFSETTLAYTLSSTSSGIELTPVTNVVSTTNSSTTRNNQVTSVSSRSRLSRQTRPRTNQPATCFTTPTSTLSSATFSSASPSSASSLSASLAAAAAVATSTTIGETLLLPSKHLVSSPSLSIQSSGLNSNLNNSSNSISMNTNSRRRTLTNRGRSNISVSITPSSTASSLSTTSSSPIIPVQPDAIHSSSSDFSTLTKSSASSETTDSSILTEGVSRPSQLAASRRTYSKKNNIVWLNPETTTITKRTNNTSTAAASSSSSSITTTTTTTTATTATTTTTNTTTSSNNSNLNDGKCSDESSGENASKMIDNIMNDSKMIDLPVDSTNDTTLTTTGISISPTSSITTTTPTTTSFPPSKLTVKPPTTLTVSNVPTLRSTKKISEPIVKSSSASSNSNSNNDNNNSATPLSPSKSTTPVSAMVSKDYSRVISNVDKSSSSPGVPSMIKVGAVPQLGRVVTPPVKITSPVKPSSPIKVTSPTVKITSPTINAKVSSPTKFGSPTKTQQATESTSDIDLDFSVIDYGESEGGGGVGVGEGEGEGRDGGILDGVVFSPAQSPSKRGVKSPTKSSISSPTRNTEKSKVSNTKEGGSESESDSVSKKEMNFVADDSQLQESGVTLPSIPIKSPTRINELSENFNKESEVGSPNTRSRKRLSESESGNDQVIVHVDDNSVKTCHHNETGTPLKKRVNFALADSGNSDLILSSPTKGVDTQSTTTSTATPTTAIGSETPNTRSRKRKSDIETMADLSDQMMTDNSVPTFTCSATEATTTPCIPPPKKRVNIALAQSNDDSDLFATPLSPVKSPKRDDTHPVSSNISTTPTMSSVASAVSGATTSSGGSILETPVSEARSTRSTRKRKTETEVETSSSADESSMREDIFSTEFSTPAKKRVNFAPGTSIEVIRDDEDEDGDDDDSESALFVDEKKKEKRLSGRKRTPVNRPLLLDSPSKALASPQPILKISKRVVDSGPLLMHFGSDSNDGESDGGGGVDCDGATMKGLLESRGPSEFFDFTINGCCFHIRHQSGRLTAFSPNESDGNYACLNNCGYRTSRMNNIILHNKDQCTVIKMQWQSEIQHLINRQRLMNQDDSTPSTPSIATTSNTFTTTSTISSSPTSKSPIKTTTITIPQEEGTLSPTHSSPSPSYETPLASPEKETIPETSETEATETAETAETTETTPITSEIE